MNRRFPRKLIFAHGWSKAQKLAYAKGQVRWWQSEFKSSKRWMNRELKLIAKWQDIVRGLEGLESIS
jgi:hypothetical protein